MNLFPIKIQCIISNLVYQFNLGVYIMHFDHFFPPFIDVHVASRVIFRVFNPKRCNFMIFYPIFSFLHYLFSIYSPLHLTLFNLLFPSGHSTHHSIQHNIYLCFKNIFKISITLHFDLQLRLPAVEAVLHPSDQRGRQVSAEPAPPPFLNIAGSETQLFILINDNVTKVIYI